MFYPLSTQLVGPTAQIKPDAVVQPLGHIRANTMPTLQQTIYGLEPLDEVKKSQRYEENRPQITISHPRMAPSSISAEEFFLARSSFSPAYNHNMAATREARTSNIHEDTPRFKDQIDIIA